MLVACLFTASIKSTIFAIPLTDICPFRWLPFPSTPQWYTPPAFQERDSLKRSQGLA